jgi:hypothetical protein
MLLTERLGARLYPAGVRSEFVVSRVEAEYDARNNGLSPKFGLTLRLKAKRGGPT